MHRATTAVVARLMTAIADSNARAFLCASWDAFRSTRGIRGGYEHYKHPLRRLVAAFMIRRSKLLNPVSSLVPIDNDLVRR
jgi:hypothetical protein